MATPGRKRKKAASTVSKTQATQQTQPTEAKKIDAKEAVAELEGEYDQTLTRHEALKQQLQKVSLPNAPGPAPRATKIPTNKTGSANNAKTGVLVPHQVPLLSKTDTHWDFVLKEMQWLSTDFTSERKRHIQSRRKLTNSVRQYFKTKESRALTALTQAESKRRKLAAKMGRDVKKWWNKMDQIVTYQQKLTYDKERHQAMNRKLVKLVQQTEMYTKSLVVAAKKQKEPRKRKRSSSTGDESFEEDEGDEQLRQLKIEEALAVGQRRRKIHDYARLANLEDATGSEREQLYGETTTDDSGSDASYEIGSESSQDDETTLEQAEREEQAERNNSSSRGFAADPVEILKLREEAQMDVNDVLERLRQEGTSSARHYESMQATEGEQDTNATKRVQFSASVEVNQAAKKPRAARRAIAADPGDDADDDGDASDVEDFVDESPFLGAMDSNYNNDEGDNEEFVDDGQTVDDETTMEEEEQLPQEISAQEEISLLKEENEMSVEELRARYAAAFLQPSMEEENDEMEEDEEEEEETEELKENKQGNSEIVVEGETEEDGEFQLGSTVEVDDETTIEAEERMGREMTYDEELSMLQRENEIPVEQLRAMYGQMQTETEIEETVEDEAEADTDADTDAEDCNIREESQEMLGRGRRRRGTQNEVPDDVMQNDIDQDNDGEFQPDRVVEVDDETTIEAEEKLGRDMSYEEELALLERENEMSVEELRAMYASGSHETSDMDVESDGSDIEGGESKKSSIEDLSAKKGDVPSASASTSAFQEDLKDDSGAEALSALEYSAELAKSTLATRPFLLSNWVKLREYQQIGLNWLVSMQARRLNGILADEMGLGKTLQTISLIAYLAAFKGIWGPHLIVVPTSVIVNWETEFKRFCPGLKILCYYGSAKQRKELRSGWTKTNCNHVVITSYQLAIQDAFAFKRKRWYYLVLDEAQNIKNFQSQRWQTLINFNTQRRLLLTGTPLQNSLMELWSLLHFLMPYIFRSRKEFSFWFENPMNDMIEGNTDENANVIGRLHGIIRPFVLRRLKKDVETQMPGKYEHIVKCSLSRRQMLMYEEFMARSSTRKALKKGGNFLGMMNVLMQLRKVCNHPDLFEPRSVVTPFVLDPVEIPMPSCVFGLDENSFSFGAISTFLRLPLWCGSQGDASIQNAYRHDTIEADQLIRLEAPIANPDFNPAPVTDDVNEELLKLETNQINSRYEARCDRVRSLNCWNTWRCQSPSFPYPNTLLKKLHVTKGKFSFDSLSSPHQVLEMRKSQQERAEEMDGVIAKFVFCIPKAGLNGSPTKSNKSLVNQSLDEMLLEPVEEYMRPFKRARARLSSFFPDKKLIQFDAGKLQTLAELLRELKAGGHRTLIFTQMSKMLDILEAFLNLNGHTYMRLDGSTGVDRRQRMMDRFNNDPRIFCFILSTRSGGTGVNLIGADTVVFYDSDWNPAMDAQAQDRVHRIGQTRDCHVYRLVTEHTIEENILMKAKQKKNLDILVMDRGKFDSSHLYSHDKSARLSSDSSDAQGAMKDVYTKGGLRSIFGVGGKEEGEPAQDGSSEAVAEGPDDEKKDMTSEQMETAMTALEDADDVEALKGAQKEAADELQEFDESADLKTVEPSEQENPTKGNKETKKETDVKDEETEKKELEKEFESWQNKVGMDHKAIEASLSPVEKYGFHFRTELDPYVSLYAVLEYKRKIEEDEEEDDAIDIDAIEREKAFEERQALADGDLLGTDPEPSDLIRLRNLYSRESARLKASKKKRTLTGENWEIRTDARFNQQFWYNVDTGEAVWDKPRLLVELEEYELANDRKWSALPVKVMLHIMSFLQPHPGRTTAARVCRQWHRGATDPSFVLHVYPVEMGAYTRDEKKMHHNHFRTLHDAVMVAQEGDTIELGDGHYWINEDLNVTLPIRIVGDENNPSRVVVEMSGSEVTWRARGGWMEGITFRRPQLTGSADPATKSLFRIEKGKLNVYQCIFDNQGSEGLAIVVSGAAGGCLWKNVSIRGGFQNDTNGSLAIDNSSL